MRTIAMPVTHPEPRVERERIVTAAPSPHRPRDLRRIRNGRIEVCTQDGWVPVRGPHIVIPGEGA